jgi:hemerythrin-like domain-containing protein
LSRDHHQALAVSLALRRADEATLQAAVARFLAFFAGEGEHHFVIEEQVLPDVLPAPMTRRMRDEHAEIRRRARELGERPAVEGAHALGALMAEHVRFEEREAFVYLEQELAPERLAEIGRRLDG